MQQTKLIRLWKTFSDRELKQFLKFLRSPFFNTNPIQISLFHLLKKAYPHFDVAWLNQEEIFAQLYPDKPFSYYHLANLFSQQFRLAETFLIQLEMEQHSFQQQKMLINAYKQRDTYDWFEKGIYGLIKKLEKEPYRDAFYYRELMDLKEIYFSHLKVSKYTLEEDVPKELMELLDRYFVLSKLQLAGVLKSREKMLAVKYEIDMLETTLEYIDKEIDEENPLFDIYKHLLKLHRHSEQISLFFKTKELFEKQIDKIRSIELKEILSQLMNYAIRQINKGNFEFNQEIFALYKIGLKHNLLLENQKMGEAMFINIAGVAGILKEFEWAMEFIQDYEFFLEKSIRSYVKSLTKGELFFRQNEFDLVIETISLERFAITLYEAKARILLIKTWFEKFLLDKNLYPFLIAQIESFEKYLIRDESLAEFRVKGYRGFLKILKKIIKHKSQHKPIVSLKENLSKQLETKDKLLGKVWLAEKIKAL